MVHYYRGSTSLLLINRFPIHLTPLFPLSSYLHLHSIDSLPIPFIMSNRDPLYSMQDMDSAKEIATAVSGAKIDPEKLSALLPLIKYFVDQSGVQKSKRRSSSPLSPERELQKSRSSIGKNWVSRLPPPPSSSSSSEEEFPELVLNGGYVYGKWVKAIVKHYLCMNEQAEPLVYYMQRLYHGYYFTTSIT